MSFVKNLAASLWTTLAVVGVISALAITVSVHGFGLRVSGGIALYFVIWWTLLFAVLPFGVRSQAEAGEIVAGSEPGAPSAPALREKAIWTTLVSSVALLLVSGLLPLSGL
jgi:predicted secreted protein